MNKFITAVYVTLSLVIGLTAWVVGVYMGAAK